MKSSNDDTVLPYDVEERLARAKRLEEVDVPPVKLCWFRTIFFLVIAVISFFSGHCIIFAFAAVASCFNIRDLIRALRMRRSKVAHLVRVDPNTP